MNACDHWQGPLVQAHACGTTPVPPLLRSRQNDGAPQVQAGQRVTIEAAGIGRLENHVVREGDAQ